MADQTDICQAMFEERGAGRVTAKIRELSSIERALVADDDPIPVVDRFLAELGFAGLGDDWRFLSRGEAEGKMTSLLLQDLAYGCALVPEPRARELTALFLANFDTDTAFFSNGFATPRTSGWSPISEATFDAGVVCMDKHQIGIFWVEDED
jgi:hypothetical protein